MNAAVLGGLVEQWVWRCRKVATQYQLGQAIDLQMEIGKLVGQAIDEARLLEASGPLLLTRVESRLDITAHLADLPERLSIETPIPRKANASPRAEALHALADAFGQAAERLLSPG